MWWQSSRPLELFNVISRSELFEFPHSIDSKSGKSIQIKYTLDPALHGYAKEILERHRPDFGVIVVMDATNGNLLAIQDYAHNTKDREEFPRLFARSNFPAASVFKIVTAAAAIDSAAIHPDFEIGYRGRMHTLYKRNVFFDARRFRPNNFVSLKEAFGKSINSFFGRLAVNYLDPITLREYAYRFYFNRSLPFELPLAASSAFIPKDDGENWGYVEAASGFTTKNSLSPIHAATIGSVVVNQGRLRLPRMIASAYDMNENKALVLPDAGLVDVLGAHTADQLSTLMGETIYTGTSRKSFRGFYRDKRFSSVVVGGKTGSLTGSDPEGKYDWFVGFAKSPDRAISFSVLTINKEYWQVKSAYLARKIIEKYFSEDWLSNNADSTSLVKNR